MSFDWSQYLILVHELVGRTDRTANEEARLRSAISRAYYAAFCQLRNWVEHAHRYKTPQHNSHSSLINWFRNRTDKRYKKIGEDLKRLRDDRNKADYDNVVRGLSSLAEKVLLGSKQTLSRSRAL